MNEILIIIILIVPSILIGLLWWNYSNKEKDTRKQLQLLALKNERLKITAPLKISAYERLIAMLERFKLFGLVMRTNKNAVGSAQLQLELINAIRNEFEMNVSMQMYVSNKAWNQVVKGKNQSMDSVKIAGVNAGPDASAMKLSQEVIMQEESHNNREIQLAIDALKQEIKATVLNG